MKVYLDTGVFIDYLSPQAIAGATLRSANRRGRTPEQLFEDAENVLKLIAASHTGATSSLTYYEVEEALFKQLESAAKGLANANALRVLAARSIMTQTVVAVRFFGISVLNLTSAIVASQLGNVELQVRGVRAADSLHVATAVDFDADVLISVDDGVLKLDGTIVNRSGTIIKCCDTDVALSML